MDQRLWMNASLLNGKYLPWALVFNFQPSKLSSKENGERGDEVHRPLSDPKLVFLFYSVLSNAIPSISRLDSVGSESLCHETFD